MKILAIIAMAIVFAVGSTARGATGTEEVPHPKKTDVAEQHAVDHDASAPSAPTPNKYHSKGDWL